MKCFFFLNHIYVLDLNKLVQANPIITNSKKVIKFTM